MGAFTLHPSFLLHQLLDINLKLRDGQHWKKKNPMKLAEYFERAQIIVRAAHNSFNLKTHSFNSRYVLERETPTVEDVERWGEDRTAVQCGTFLNALHQITALPTYEAYVKRFIQNESELLTTWAQYPVDGSDLPNAKTRYKAVQPLTGFIKYQYYNSPIFCIRSRSPIIKYCTFDFEIATQKFLDQIKNFNTRYRSV